MARKDLPAEGLPTVGRQAQRRKESPLPPCKGEFSQLAFNFGNKKFRISPKDFPSQFNSYASKDATPPF